MVAIFQSGALCWNLNKKPIALTCMEFEKLAQVAELIDFFMLLRAQEGLLAKDFFIQTALARLLFNLVKSRPTL